MRPSCVETTYTTSLPPLFGDQGQALPVRGPRDRAAQQRDALELDAALAPDDAPDHAAVDRRHEVDVGVLAAVREVGDAVALRGDRRRRVHVALVRAMIGELARELLRVLLDRDRRPVAALEPFAPLLVKLRDRDPGRALEGVVEAVHLADAPQQVAQAVLAVAVPRSS